MANKKQLTELNALPAGEFAAVLGGIFEHSPWIAEAAAAARPFASTEELHAAMVRIVRDSAPARQLALIHAHPDLAGRLARQGQLTAESAHEHAAAGFNEAAPEVLSRIEELNAAWRRKFGFSFIICARLNKVDTILAAMERRLGNSKEEETAAALEEIYKIAKLRLHDCVEA